MILSGVMWHMSFVCSILKLGGFTWSTFAAIAHPGFQWIQSCFSWHKVEEEPPDPKFDPKRQLATRTKARRHRIMRLGLLAAMTKMANVPNIHLGSSRKFRSKLRKSRGRDGMLMTAKLSEQDLSEIRKVLEALPVGTVNAHDTIPIILDTGCSRVVTGIEDDFISPPAKLDVPIALDGIAGSLFGTHVGRVRYEVISDTGEVCAIETEALFMPQLKCRLFSPQRFFMEVQKVTGKEGFMKVLHDRTEFHHPSGECTTVAYNEITFLPILQGFKSVDVTADSLLLMGNCVSGEANQNITHLQKLLLRCHFRVGHLGFQQLQWIGRQGWMGSLGSLGAKWGHSTVYPPKCASCLFGKQENSTQAGTTETKPPDPEGALKKEKLNPGHLIFSDLSMAVSSESVVPRSLRRNIVVALSFVMPPPKRYTSATKLGLLLLRPSMQSCVLSVMH